MHPVVIMCFNYYDCYHDYNDPNDPNNGDDDPKGYV